MPKIIIDYSLFHAKGNYFRAILSEYVNFSKKKRELCPFSAEDAMYECSSYSPMFVYER